MRKLLLGVALAAVYGGTALAAVQPKAVVANYSDLAQAGYEDALASARNLRKAVDALVAQPSPDTLKAARQAWLEARRTSRPRPTASAMPSSMTGKAGSTPGRWTKA